MRNSLLWKAALTTALAVQPALARQDSADAPQAPCMSDVYDDFDFWVGEWNVYGADGSYAGHNRIEKMNGGCLIWEHWTGGSGSVGDSMNYYDLTAGAWRQVWVSQGATIDYTGGLNAAGEMVLEGKIAYPANGLIADFRGTWTPQDDGTVRQYFQQMDAAGDWQDWFTGIYVREEDDPRAAEAAELRAQAGQ